MPHFKCVTCRTRLFTAGGTIDVCDGCGSSFEPVVELTEVVGYQAIARRSAQAQAQRDADLWLDEGSVAAAVAIALRETDR